MKKFIILMLLFCLTSCSNTKNTTSDLSKYGSWKKSVSKIISNDFSDTLPVGELVNKYGKEYYFNKAQGLLGDLNFVIMVELKFPDVSSYQEALKSYEEYTAIATSEGIYHTAQGSQEEIELYTDSQITDGIYYNFEFVSANEDNLSLCIINARAWDYFKDTVLIEHLEKLLQVYKKQ